MKIESKPTSSGTWTTITDEANGGTCEDFSPTQSQDNLVAPLASDGTVGSQFTKYLGNSLEALMFECHNTYASRTLALAAVRTLMDNFKTTVHLRVTEGSEVQYYPNAVLDSMTRRLGGVGVTFTMHFRSQAVQSSLPS